MEDFSHPPLSEPSTASLPARPWLTARTGALVSVIGVALVILALPLSWFDPGPVLGFHIVFYLLTGAYFPGFESSRGFALLELLGLFTAIYVLILQVSAFGKPDSPTPIWWNTGCLLFVICTLGVLPHFFDGAFGTIQVGSKGKMVVPLSLAPGYSLALAGFLVILLGSLVKGTTALRAQRQATSSTAPQEAARRRIRNALGWGLVVGLLPLGLTLMLLLLPSRILLTTGQFVVDTGIYGVAWVGAVLFRIRSTTQSHRAFAKGMLIALLLTSA